MRCSFCTSPIKEGTGKMYVKNSGQILYFCSRKCERYYLMGRKREKLKWVKKINK